MRVPSDHPRPLRPIAPLENCERSGGRSPGSAGPGSDASDSVDQRRYYLNRRAADGGRQSLRLCEQLRHFPFRHFELSEDRGFVHAANLRSTATNQLGGSKRGEYDELKRANAGRRLNHSKPPQADQSGNVDNSYGNVTLTVRLL